MRFSLRTRRLAKLALGFGLALVLTSCARNDDPDQLVFWTIGREGEAIAKLIPDFEREYPQIHVKVQQLPLTAAHQKLLTAIAGGFDLVAFHCQAPRTKRAQCLFVLGDQDTRHDSTSSGDDVAAGDKTYQHIVRLHRRRGETAMESDRFTR